MGSARAARVGRRRPRAPRLPVAALALLALPLACRAREIDPDLSWPTPRAPAIATPHALATLAALAQIESGGNAADAAVAAAFVLTVVRPGRAGIASSGLALWVPHEGEPQVLDFLERAPSGLTSERLEAGARGAEGDLCATVGAPGLPAGLWALQQRLGSGKRRFRDLIAPAIALARAGVRVDDTFEAALKEPGARERLGRDPASRAVFYPDGVPRLAGEQLELPGLVGVLERIAADGPDGFYRGPTARMLVTEVVREARGEARGLLSSDDLRAYEPSWRPTLRGWFRGHEVFVPPPPCANGLALLQLLSILEGFPLSSQRDAVLGRRASLASGQEPAPAERSGLDERAVHAWLEALRIGWEEGASAVADPAVRPLELNRLLSSSWTARARIEIGRSAAARGVQRGPPSGEDGTVVSIVDADGDAVVLCFGLGSAFGTGVLVEEGDFLLGDRLGRTGIGRLAAADGETPRAGARPPTSYLPAILRRGGHTNALTIGSVTGAHALNDVAGVALRITVYGERLGEACAAPRFDLEIADTPSAVFEPGWSDTLRQGLGRLGHATSVAPRTRGGGLQAVYVDAQGASTSADGRRAGP